MTCWPTSTAEAVTRRFDTRGGFARSAMLSRSQPQRPAWRRAAERMAWVADGLGRLPDVQQGAVEGVEVLRVELVELELPEPGADGPVHLGAVVADRRRREVEAFALLEPPVEHLADRDADPVGAASGPDGP